MVAKQPEAIKGGTVIRTLTGMVSDGTQALLAFLANRAPRWPKLRREHLEREPRCAACGTKEGVVPHHVVLVSVDPRMELEPTNLITLCESKTHNCHLIWGHLLDWSKGNPHVRADAAAYFARLQEARNAH